LVLVYLLLHLSFVGLDRVCGNGVWERRIRMIPDQDRKASRVKE
jgi:hypothetical protein